ncbi:unnamed protein product [Protopolystoma xenopodis]|uniref:Uncharacterized protein n=1 Tax=Protopolystoma xenopodis TaxID=117903 RepID=A0A448XMW8_9PLAT|nr:unnamed protein product [Protopolystoma xenopodis]
MASLPPICRFLHCLYWCSRVDLYIGYGALPATGTQPLFCTTPPTLYLSVRHHISFPHNQHSPIGFRQAACQGH